MTARNIQNEAKAKGLPWDMAKGYDTFLPLSQAISKTSLRNPYASEIWLKVNGEVRQCDSPGLMLFRLPRILHEISKVMTLEKDDIVLTGTPKGVGPVVHGDLIEAGIRNEEGTDIPHGNITAHVEDAKH